MTNIEITLNDLINSVTKNREEIDYLEVSESWKKYLSFHHSLASALSLFENTLLRKSMEEHPEDCIIKFGQFMENFRWSLNKKNKLTNIKS